MREAVQIRVDGYIAEVVLNNPEKYNALSHDVVEGLHQAAATLSLAPDVRVVIVHGGDSPAFCSGADLRERAGMPDPDVYRAVHRLREAIAGVERLPMPAVAAVHGACFGGGLELAMACDIRIAAEDARLGLTELQWAIIPGAGGTQRLPRIVGVSKAKEMIFTAARLDAAEAGRIGLVSRVVPRERLLEEARAVAERIAELGPVAARMAKRAMNAGLEMGDGLAVEWECYQATIPTEDRQEGLRAFAEKRKPVYRGR